MKNSFYLIYSILFLLLLGCRSDSVLEVETTQTDTETTTFHTINLNGRVVDEAGEGVADATVYFQGETLTTDAFGLFRASSISAPASGLYVKVFKDGYFVGGTQVYPRKETTVLNLEAFVTLAAKQAPEFFESSAGFDKVFSDQSEISIPADAITRNGVLYDGQVEMNFKWLDPTAASTRSLMPGALLGETINGDRQLLRTFGMIGVELSDPSGEELNIAGGSMASLKFPLPSEVSADAPQEIPLWHFNETSGVWEEDGTAVRSGDFYAAEVSHFSWWNCDVPMDLTELCITFVDSRGVAINNTTYCLLCDQLGLACDDVNNDNTVCNLAPTDQVLTLSMLDNCGFEYYSEEIGPFSGPQDEITVIVNYPPNYEAVVLEGTVTDCDGDPVADGFVEAVTSSGTFYDYNLDNGNYSISYLLCDENNLEVELNAVDLSSLQRGNTQLVIDPSVNPSEANITACGVPAGEYMIIRNTQTGAVFFADQCKISQTAVETIIEGIDDQNTTGGPSYLGIKGFGVGGHKGNIISGSAGSIVGNVGEGDDIDLTDFIIIQYGEVGEYVAGSFSFNNILTGEFSGIRTQ